MPLFGFLLTTPPLAQRQKTLIFCNSTQTAAEPGPHGRRAMGGYPFAAPTVDGKAKSISHHLETMVETIVCGYLRGNHRSRVS